MELFLKVCGCAVLSVVLFLTLGSRKELATVLAVAGCCLIFMTLAEYLRPVIAFVDQLEEVGGLDHSMIQILLKVVGIGLISEICALVCNDSGCSSIGKTVKLIGTAVILWLSLPLYTKLLELLQRILGGL